MTNFQNTLTTANVIEEFRKISQMFRDGSYGTQPYYEHCKVALGEQFNEIFPELLALLPDISKQQVKFFYSIFKNLFLIRFFFYSFLGIVSRPFTIFKGKFKK